MILLQYRIKLLMIGVVLGVASFLIFFWIDAVSIRKLRWIKAILFLATAALFGWGLLLTLSDPSRIALPSSLRTIGWIFGALFGMAMVYSLFLEIPFVTAYLRSGHPTKVVSRGTYALCRHPGVLWFAGLMASVFLVSGSPWMLLAAPVWAGLNVFYVFLQEKFYFIPMFGTDYASYQQRVPMLIPTKSSVHECARTLFRRETQV